MNFELLKNKLKKVLNPSRFRFVVILHPNLKTVQEIKDHITHLYPESAKVELALSGKSYQDISTDLYKNSEGFVFINDFDEVLNDPKLYNGFNQRRDKIASFNINLICFISTHHKEALFTKAINVIPDLWEFKNTVLELELDKETDELTDLKIIETSHYSSLGGLTASGKKIELVRLRTNLKEAKTDDQQLNLFEQISRINSDLGRFTEALKYQKKIVAIEIDLLDPKDPMLATSYNNLAMIYKELGKLNKALKYQKKALDINEAALDGKHPILAANYTNFGSLYLQLGNATKALHYQKKALAIREEILEANHPDLATSYHNLASIYKNSGKLTEALNYLQKALAIHEAVLDPLHPTLATIYRELGKLKEALQYQQKAIEINEGVLDENHPNLAASYSNLALIYLDLDDHLLAEEYFKKSFKLVLFNKDAHRTMDVFSGLIHCLLKNKKYQEANTELGKVKSLGLKDKKAKQIILKAENDIKQAQPKRAPLTRNQMKRQKRKK